MAKDTVKLKRRESDGRYLPEQLDGLNRPKYAMQLLYACIDGAGGMDEVEFQLCSQLHFSMKKDAWGKGTITVERTLHPLMGEFWNGGAERRVTDVHMVVGNNGAGKTTFLREIMLRGRADSVFLSPHVFIWGSGAPDQEGKLCLETLWCTNSDFTLEVEENLHLYVRIVPSLGMEKLWTPYHEGTGDDFRSLIQGNKLIYLHNVMGRPLDASYVADYSLSARLVWDADGLEKRGNVLFRVKTAGEAARNIIGRYYNYEIYNQLTFIRDMKKKGRELPGEVKAFLPRTINVYPVSLWPLIQWETGFSEKFDEDAEKLWRKSSFTHPDSPYYWRDFEERSWQQYICHFLMIILWRESKVKYKDDDYGFVLGMQEDLMKMADLLPEESKSTREMTDCLERYCKMCREEIKEDSVDKACEACLEFWDYFVQESFPKEHFSGKYSDYPMATVLSLEDFQGLEHFLEEYNKICPYYYFLEFNWGLSSGEMNFLNQLAYLNQAATRFSCCSEQSAEGEIPTLAGNILLMIDEADLSYHPEWQRKYLAMLLKMLPVMFSYEYTPQNDAPDGKVVKNPYIQVILTTHSPIMLADMPPQAVIYLKRENGRTTAVPAGQICSAFGQNVYRLFEEAFFLPCPMGEFAVNKINEALAELKGLEESLDAKTALQGTETEAFSEEEIQEDRKVIERIAGFAELIGDDFLKSHLQSKCDRCRSKLQKAVYGEKDSLELEIKQLETRLEELKKRRK